MSVADDRRQAEAIQQAADDWLTVHGRYGDGRINTRMRQAFAAGYAFAGDEVARMQRDIRDMERDFRAAMQELRAEHAQQMLDAKPGGLR